MWVRQVVAEISSYLLRNASRFIEWQQMDEWDTALCSVPLDWLYRVQDDYFSEREP